MKKVLILILFTFNFNISNVFGQNSNIALGSIFFNLKFKSISETGLGGKIKILNLETKEIFEGKSSMFSTQIRLSNLPNGIYKVSELTIFTGGGKIYYRDFRNINQFEIKNENSLYLGSYLTKKTKQVFKLNYEIVIDRNLNIENIKKEALKFNGSENKLDFQQTLFKTDTTFLSF